MYRIVHNEQSGVYRIEKRGLLGWAFVSDQDTGDYLGFSDLHAARSWVCNATRTRHNESRRWKIIADCDA